MKNLRTIAAFLGLAVALAAAEGQVDSMLEDFDLEDKVMKEMHKQAEPLDVKYLTKPYVEPSATPNAFFRETFQVHNHPAWHSLEDAEKFKGEIKVEKRKTESLVGDLGMRMRSRSQYHGIAAKMAKEFDPSKHDALYGSMEVQWEDTVNCGGSYFKLFHTDKDASTFNDKTDYAIMFGPDRCGFVTNKVHFIVKHPNPIDSEAELIEEHLTSPPKLPSGRMSHHFAFAIKKDGTMKMWVNNNLELEGDMKTLFKEPAFGAPKEIEDPNDKKPSDWVEEKMIPDPDASKPADWDEDAPAEIPDEDAVMPEGWKEDVPSMIPNPDATKPEDWDDAEDGEWKAPLVKNPECYIGCGKWKRPMKANPNHKGKWAAPMIANPEYKGVWAPRKIDNPKYYSIQNPWDAVQKINAIGFELWVVDAGVMFDNILITPDEAEFTQFVKETYEYKKETEIANAQLRKEAEEAQIEKQKEDKNAEGSTGLVGSLFAMWRDAAQASMITLILTITMPIASTMWLVSRYLRSRVPKPTTAEPQTDKKTDKKADDKADDKASPEEKDKAEVPAVKETKPARKLSAEKAKKGEGEEEPQEDSMPTSATAKTDKAVVRKRSTAAAHKD